MGVPKLRDTDYEYAKSSSVVMHIDVISPVSIFDREIMFMDSLIRICFGFSFGMLIFCSAPSQAQEEKGPIYLDEPGPSPKPAVAKRQKVVQKYEDETNRVERQVAFLSDGSNMNDGLYTQYYRGGQKYMEGQYSEGVHTGQWHFWHSNGQICKSVAFKKGRPDGEWEVFRSDGTNQAKKSYQDGKRHGRWVVFYEDGKTKKIEINYMQGKAHGEKVTYLPSGKKHQQLSFKNGLTHGKMIEWNEAGDQIAELNFIDGKKDGEVVWTKELPGSGEAESGSLLPEEQPTDESQE